MTPEDEDELHTDLKNSFWGFDQGTRKRLADYALPVAIDRIEPLEQRIEKQRYTIQRLLKSLREARSATIVEWTDEPSAPDVQLPIEDLPPYFEELSQLAKGQGN
jgi:hypothetical protein